MFLKCIDDFNLIQLNDVLSDLILTNNPDMCSEVSKCDIYFTSDHAILLFDIHKIQKKPELKTTAKLRGLKLNILGT